jgi:proteic killer suppression protein
LLAIYNVIRYTPLSTKTGSAGRGNELIVSFADKGTEDLFNGEDTRQARRTLPRELWRAGGRKLDMLNAATSLNDLRFPPGNRLEALRRDRKGQHSVRINDQYRVCFRWTDNGPDEVEITDYH